MASGRYVPRGAEALDFIYQVRHQFSLVEEQVLLVPKVIGDTTTSLVAGMGESFSTEPRGGGETVPYPPTNRQAYTRWVLDMAILTALATTNNIDQELIAHVEADQQGEPRVFCFAENPAALAGLDAHLHVVAQSDHWEPSSETYLPTRNGNTLRQAVCFDTARTEAVRIIGTVAFGVADMAFPVMWHPQPSWAFDHPNLASPIRALPQ